MRLVIADLTKAHPGSESGLLRSLLSTGYSQGPVILVCHEGQASGLSTVSPQANVKVLPDSAHYTDVMLAVVDLIDEQVKSTSLADELTILSFHAAVLQLQPRYAKVADLRIRCGTWGNFFRNYGPPREPQGTAWPADFMPKEEAVQVLCTALARYAAPVQLCDLRTVLVSVDSKFAKESSSAAATPGLLKQLVTYGSYLGRVRVQYRGEDKANPLVSLVEKQGTESSAVEYKTTQSAEKLSKRMEAHLRPKKLGPFAQLREELFNNLESAAKAKLTLREVIAKAVTVTREDRGGGQYPWRDVQEFLITLMKRRPIALDDSDKVIIPDSTGRGTVVSSLRSNWRREWEGEILVGVIEEINDIDVAYAAPDFALLLYHTADTRRCTYVDELLSDLVKSGRLFEDSRTGYLSVSLQGAQRTSVDPAPMSPRSVVPPSA